jgi:hypothetical protein
MGLVFYLCVGRINDLGNASNGPILIQKPSYGSFVEAVTLIDILHKEGYLAIGLDTENRKELILKFLTSNKQTQNLKSLLGLDQNSSEFQFGSNFLDKCNTRLVVRTRSLMEVLFYLSHAVSVPQKDIDEGLITKTVDENGEIFNWNRHLSEKWITINCSETEIRKRPPDAFVGVFYQENGSISPIMI